MGDLTFGVNFATVFIYSRGGVIMNTNGNRVLASMANREVKNEKNELSRNMTYTNGAWGDSHRG